MPTLRSTAGFSYVLTAEDLDWASRMVAEEGGSNAGTLWTMAQRFVLTGGHGTFASFIRAYSQPINPKWLADGEFCRPGGAHADETAPGQACSARRLAVREHAQSPSTRYPAELAFAQLWARGGVPNNVPRAVHFADESVSRSCISEARCKQPVLIAGHCPACNWYMPNSESTQWPEDFVTIDGTGASSPLLRSVALGAGIGLVLVGLGLAALELRA